MKKMFSKLTLVLVIMLSCAGVYAQEEYFHTENGIKYKIYFENEDEGQTVYADECFVYQVMEVLDENLVIPSYINVEYLGESYEVEVSGLWDSVFYGLDGVKSVTLPATVMYINEHIFGENPMLENIFVMEGNPVLKSIDGILYISGQYGMMFDYEDEDEEDLSEDELYWQGRYPSDTVVNIMFVYPTAKGEGSYIIPDVAFGIMNSFFDTRYEEITVPESVKLLAGNPFASENISTLKMLSSEPPHFMEAGIIYNSATTTLCVPLGAKENYLNDAGWSQQIGNNSDNVVENCSSSIDEVSSSLMLSLYPNPTKDNALVRIEGNDSDVTLYLSDIQGRILYNKTVNKNEKEVNLPLENLKSGIYYVKVVNDQTSSVVKIVKE